MAFEIIALPPEEDDVFPKAEMRFVSGDDGRFTIYLEDPDPDWVDPDPDADPPNEPDMVPRDLTGWSAQGQIRKSNKLTDRDGVSVPVLAELDFSGFGTDGFIQAHLSHTESAKVRIAAMWDVQLIDPSGNVDTITGGPANPFGDVTRDE